MSLPPAAASPQPLADPALPPTADVLVVDADQPRPGGPRRVVEVAVGVLVREDGAVLLTTRPGSRAYAGYWEFPGGKIEAGETVQAALQRELHEELGIEAQTIEPGPVLLVDYPHALVRLHCCLVRQWRGELSMREGQDASWQHIPQLSVTPVLPGTWPVLQWLQNR